MWLNGNQRPRKKDNINKELKQIDGFIEEDKAKVLLYRFLKENPTYAVNLMMGVDLFPFQHILIKGIMNSDYSMLILSRGGSKSYIAGISASLLAIFNQGYKIGIISASFRQSRSVIKKIEDIANKPDAGLLANCITEVKKGNDSWTLEIGNSEVIALPLGCLRGDSLITYENGLKEISKNFPSQNDNNSWVVSKENIWSENEFRESDKKYYHGIDKTKIITTNRGYSIEGTLAHKIKVLDSDCEIVWREFKDVKRDDFAVIDRSYKPLENKSGITKEQAYFVGGLVGDGCFTNKYRLEFINTDMEFVDTIKKYTPQYKWVTYDNNRFFVLSKKAVDEFYDFWGMKALYSYEKYIPEKVLCGGLDNIASFIKGLMDSDGTLQVAHAKGGTGVTVSYTTVSKRLAEQMQQCFLLFGIISRLKSRDRNKPGETRLRRVYEILISGRDAEKYAKFINFGISRKRNKLNDGISQKIRNNTCLDGVPYVKKRLLEILEENRNTKHLGEKRDDHLGYCAIKKKKIITNYVLNNFIKKFEFLKDERVEKLKMLLNEDFYFDKIISTADSKCETFDLSVPKTHSYCANGFISHNSGEKLRGFRFNVLMIDEFLLFNEKVFNEVILPFIVVPPEKDIKTKTRVNKIEDKLIKMGKMKEGDRTHFENNKLIVLSSASYKFEYLYKLYEEWYKSIIDPTKEDKIKFIVQLAYEAIPPEMHDRKMVENAKQSMSASAFSREFGAQFSEDSSGFYSTKKMLACTKRTGETPSVEIKGDPKSKYILSFDPSWADNEDSDDFAMHVFKLDEQNKSGTLVHSYALPGANQKDHIHYMKYLLKNFNIVFVCGDYNGALQFISSANGSTDWQKDNLVLDMIDAPLNDPSNYSNDIRLLKSQYEAKTHKCYLRTPSPQWIREANQSLQNAFEKQQIWFASKAIDTDSNSAYTDQLAICDNVDDLIFETMVKGEDDEFGNARKIDFIERQGTLIDLTKVECAMVQLVSNSQGGQKFDLPPEYKRQKGPDRARKDSYSALVLGNYGIKLYFDIIAQESDEGGFIPFLI